MVINASMYHLCFIMLLIITAIATETTTAANEKHDFIKVEFTKKLDVDKITKATYTDFLKDLRKTLADTYSGKQKVPVLPVYNAPKPRGFQVNYVSGSTTVPVIFRRDNLYTVGYQSTTPKATWFEFDQKVEPGETRSPFIKNSEWLPFKDDYLSLERYAGVAVVNMEIDKFKLKDSVIDLATSTTDGAKKARALLLLIQMFSEATRFVDIANLFSTSLDTTVKLPQWMQVDLEKNWDKHSTNVLCTEADPTYKFEPQTINGKAIKNADDLRNFFGAMYRDASTLKPPCKKGVYYDEMNKGDIAFEFEPKIGVAQA